MAIIQQENRVPTYRVEKNTFIKDKVPIKERHIEIEIGDEKEPGRFLPQFKTKHWDNECNFSIRLVDGDLDSGVVRTIDNKMEWERDGRVARFYEKETTDEDGAFEFEIELAEKPASNELLFTIQHKGLRFIYQQPELIEEEVTLGSTRFENAKGSYVVYHESKRDHIIGQKNYGPGKAFWIPRPYVTDANGRREWCELNINAERTLLRIVIPQDFVDTAVYPIVVDPTVGYTTLGTAGMTLIGGNTSTHVAQMIGNSYALGTAGTLDSIHAGISKNDNNASNVDIFAALYRENDPSSNNHAMVVGIEKANESMPLLSSGGAWKVFTAASEELSADTYIIGIVANGDDNVAGTIQVLHDLAVVSTNLYVEAVGLYAARIAEDPWTEDATASTTGRSLYFTYTAGGSALTKTLTDSMSIADVILKKPTKNLLDSMSVAEALSNKPSLFKSDSIGIADVMASETGKVLTENVAISDAMVNRFGKAISETINLSDVFTKVSKKVFADTVSISDSIVTLNLIQKVITDSFVISDVLAKTFGLGIDDTLAIADSVVKAAVKSLTDNLPIADSLNVVGPQEAAQRIYRAKADIYKRMSGAFSNKSDGFNKKLY